MGDRGARIAGCLTAILVALGMAGLSSMTAQADPTAAVTPYPRLDGAVAAQPLALAQQRASTTSDLASSDVVFHGTAAAYQNLYDGAADLILVPTPTRAELNAATAAGHQLETIPIAKDGLVFLTDPDNPVATLSLDQLRGIYSGAITDWSQVGGLPGPITAFQHVDTVDSQIALVDQVMKGTPLASPPSDDGSVTSFAGQPGGIGYAPYSYIQAVWGTDSPLVKPVAIDGVAATAATIGSGDYSLTTSYDIVFQKSQPADSPTRKLAQQMVTAQGQGVVLSAGYIPVGPADPVDPARTATEVDTTLAIASLDQTYAINPLTITTRTSFVAGAGHCATVDRVSVTGLKDASLADRLASDFRNQQDEFLKQTWAVTELTEADSCPAAHSVDLTLTAAPQANFGNLLSLVSNWSVPGSAETHPPAATLNIRLDNGQPLTLADLFVTGANLAAMIHAASPADDQIILAQVDQLRNDPDQAFSFTPSAVRIYLSPAVTIDFTSRWHQVAAFNLAASVEGLYTATAPASCPVLTTWSAGNCWAAKTVTLASLTAPYEGTTLSVPLNFATGDQWRVTGYEGLSSAPELAGTGPAVMSLKVPFNTTSAVRQITVDFAVIDHNRHLAYQARISVSQSVQPAWMAPTILTANATNVVGRVSQPTWPGEQVIVTWPDGSLSAPITVGADAVWTVATPAGMASGMITAVASNGSAETSQPATALLDTQIPDAPVVTAASAGRVSGSLHFPVDAGTTVEVTWPDSTLAAPITVSPDATWSVRSASREQDTGGVIMVVAVDQAGNRSLAVTVTVPGPVPDPEQSQITITSDPLEVTVPNCGGVPTAASDMVVVDVLVLDAAGQTMPGQTVAFQASGGLLLTQDYAIADDQGVASVFGLIDPVLVAEGGHPQVRASVSVDGSLAQVAGSPILAPMTVERIADPPTVPEITISSATKSADGSPVVAADAHSAYQVQAQWVDGCGVPLAGRTVNLQTTGSAVLSQTVVVLDETGKAQWSVTDAVSETVTVTASSFDPEVPTAEAQLAFSPPAPDPNQSTLRTTDLLAGIPCGGPGQTTVQATVKDANGRAVSEVTVRFATEGQAVLSSPSAVTNASGLAITSLSDATPETVTITASLASGEPLGSPTQVTFIPACAPPKTISFAVGNGPRLADGHDQYQLTVYARDLNGSSITGLADRLVVVPGRPAQATNWVDRGNGTYTTTITSDTPGVVPVRVAMKFPDGSVRDLANSPASLTFIPVWGSGLAVGVDTEVSPVTNSAARAANGQDSYTITVRASVRLAGSTPLPVAGQSRLLSIMAVDDYGQPMSLPSDLLVSGFTEQQPGVYTVRVASLSAGVRQLVVQWQEPGAETAPTQRLTVQFVPA